MQRSECGPAALRVLHSLHAALLLTHIVYAPPHLQTSSTDPVHLCHIITADARGAIRVIDIGAPRSCPSPQLLRPPKPNDRHVPAAVQIESTLLSLC